MRHAVQLVRITAVVFFVGLFSLAAQAQTRTPNTAPRRPAAGSSAKPPGMGIAVVDVAYIFKNYSRFKKMMADLKAEVDATERSLRAEQQRLADKANRLKGFGVGTPEYRRTEEEIAGEMGGMRTTMELKRRHFREQEATVFYQVYVEVCKEVEYVAQRRGIALVVRFNNEPINGQDPTSVMKGVNRNILYHQEGLDITSEVLDGLTRRLPAEERGRADHRLDDKMSLRPR